MHACAMHSYSFRATRVFLQIVRRGIELDSSFLETTVPATAATQDSTESQNDPTKHRRRWTVERKWEIVRESFDPVESLHEVAARYDVNPSQLSRWRSLYRDQIRSAARACEHANAHGEQNE
ncbi:transposase [Burkholderia sp. AW49-1]